MLTIDDIQQAHQRIKSHIHQTPILESTLLNEWLGHRILFKAECLQKIGAFKIRGAVNAIAKMLAAGNLPKHVVANSSGNHAQAVALASNMFGIKATIFAGSNISPIKAAATQAYGATIKLFDTRLEADAAVQAASKEKDTVWLPPFNHPDIMAGQGTAVFEALQQTGDIDAVAIPCGGGGLLSGSFVAAKSYDQNIRVIGAEPLLGNDAAQSRRHNNIVTLTEAPKTMADGAATPSVGNLTFPFIQQCDAFYEVPEESIQYWTQWLQHLLKLHVEPTSAMTMQAVVDWLKETAPTSQQTILVVLSGGNIATEMMQQIWREDCLTCPPIFNV